MDTNLGNVSKKKVNVAVAIIFSDDNRILIAQRSQTGPFPGKWEFPGGKIQQHETPEHALRREIHEELDVKLDKVEFWKTSTHAYPELEVHLKFFLCTIDGSQELKLLVHQQLKWVTLEEAKIYDFLEADIEALDSLTKGGFSRPFV